MNGRLFFTFALRDPNTGDDVRGVGNGFVVVFNSDGSVASRFASNGNLNAPWAITVAPSGFGPFAGDVLVGNFGDGMIGAYNPASGAFIDWVRDSNQNIIAIDGLWGLAFGPGNGSTSLYFAAGINNENDGLLGVITPH